MRLLLALVLVFMGGPAFAADPAPAQATAPSGVLVVDIKRLLDESTASVNSQKKVEARRSAFQTEIADKEKTIRDAADNLQQQRGKIDATAYAAKEDQLRQQFRDVEQYVQDRRRVLELATANAMNRVRDAMMRIATDIAHKRGAQAVLSKQQVMWSENSIDITDQVLQRLNTELPDIDVVIEPAAGEPPAKAAAPAKASEKAK